MRRLPIPGTNLTPFMAMRGREPLLPIDLPLAGEAPVPNIELDEHVRELQKTISVAAKSVKSAAEISKAKNKDLHDLGRKQITFVEGDLVRYWNMPKSTTGQ